LSDALKSWLDIPLLPVLSIERSCIFAIFQTKSTIVREYIEPKLSARLIRSSPYNSMYLYFQIQSFERAIIMNGNLVC
jgi:hypothetical protein